MTESLQAELPGAWELISWTLEWQSVGSAETQTHLPFGEKPGGLLLYSPGGWMSATVHAAKRTPFPDGQSPRKLDTSTVARAYTSYFHYAGPWRIENRNVIHSVRHALNPNMVGTEQIRAVQLDGSSLVLTGLESIKTVQRRHVLAWKRITP